MIVVVAKIKLRSDKRQSLTHVKLLPSGVISRSLSSNPTDRTASPADERPTTRPSWASPSAKFASPLFEYETILPSAVPARNVPTGERAPTVIFFWAPCMIV